MCLQIHSSYYESIGNVREYIFLNNNYKDKYFGNFYDFSSFPRYILWFLVFFSFANILETADGQKKKKMKW